MTIPYLYPSLLLWLLLSMGDHTHRRKEAAVFPKNIAAFAHIVPFSSLLTVYFVKLGSNFILILHMYKCDSDRKESTCNARDPGSVPGLGRSPGEGNGYLFHCFCQENSMDRGSWQARITSDPSPWGCKELDMTEKLTLSRFSSVAQSYLTLCNPMDGSMQGLPVHHQLLEFTQTHVH